MRRWRVGTFSMGITLMFVGITLILVRFKEVQEILSLMQFWPGVLILLGIEILVYLGFSKEEEPKVKYDGVSIFLILFLTFTGIGATAALKLLEIALKKGLVF